MKKKTNPIIRDRIFLSLHEKEVDSNHFGEGFEKFFKHDWGLNCKLIKHSTAIIPAWDEIQSYLESSLYFIQLFSTQPKVSEWMEKERLMYETLHKGKQGYNPAIILYTKKTNRQHPSFEDLETLIKRGYVKAFQIDDPKDAHRFAIGIIKGLKRIDDPKDELECKIGLPECCQPLLPERIIASPIGKFVGNFFEANMRGLEVVYPDRKTAMEWLRRKFKDITQGETVLMAGITLKRYVHPKYVDSEGRKGLGKEFESAIIKKNVKVKLLLLQPRCKAARKRSTIETPGVAHNKSLLVTDYKDVKEYYDKPKFQGKVRIEYYDQPYVGLVIFDDEIYIELYHVGSGLADKNICGHVPILVARKDSIYYRLFKSHFENFWPKGV